jgi:predicted permease
MLSRVRGLFSPGGTDSAFDAELESHLQLHVDDNVRAGMPLEEARRQALLALGGIEPARQQYREQSSLPWVEHLIQDLRFAFRHLAKAPGFTITSVLTMSLGFGAALAIYAFLDAALVRPLPYARPDRLLDVTERTPDMPHANLSYPDYLDWKTRQTVFSAFDFYTGRGVSLTTPAGLLPVRGARVSAGFFRTLGVRPLLGRDFHAGEDQPDAAATTILSYGAWQKYFGGRPDIVGRTASLNGEPSTIVGVLPASFHFALAGPADFWVPFHAAKGCDLARSCHGLVGVARLKDGASLETARAQMQSIAAQLEREYPRSNRSQGAAVSLLSAQILGDIQPILLLLLVGAGLLLVIALVNVISLLLVRSEGRKRELAVRSTLGASGWRLVRQFVTEAVVLVGIGLAAGAVLSALAIHLLFALLSEDMRGRMPYLDATGFNWRVGLVAAGLAIVSIVLFTLAPAVRVRFAEMREGLAEGARGSSGTTWRRLGFKLVVVELAMAMVLLVGAGLLGRSLYRLLNVELGFDANALATINVAAPGDRFRSDDAARRLVHDVTARVSALPGVQSVGLVDILPVSFNGNTTWIRVAGHPYNGEHNEVNQRVVDAGYFSTVRARILRGRGITSEDTATSRKVIVINEALARKYFAAGEDPVGRQIGDSDLSPDSLTEVVGIVEDIRDGALNSEIWPAIYYPMEQQPGAFFAVVARTAGAAEPVVAALPAALREIDRDLVTLAPSVMRERIQDSPAAYLQRSSASLVGGFAGLALVLGIIGLYGVIAYSVSQRTREIGLRLALGADQRTVYGMIVGEAGRLVVAGLVVGAIAAIPAGLLMRTLLFGTEPWDLPTLAGVAAVLAVCALVASFVPARRAASVNPIEALRVE